MSAPDTEGKPCPTCHHQTRQKIWIAEGNFGWCPDLFHTKLDKISPATNLAPAAQPANLADGGDSFETFTKRLIFHIGNEMVQLAEAATYETGQGVGISHEAINTHANQIIAAHKEALAAHDQALKSQLLAAVGELPRYRWGEDQLVLDRDEGGVVSLQSTVNAINTVYKDIER